MDVKKAVIFDLDGTLVDTIADIGNAVNAVLGRRGFPLHDLEDYKWMVGWGMRKLVASAVPESAKDEGTMAATLAETMEEYSRRPVVLSRPYVGIEELLSALSARGIACSVLSNKPDALCRTVVSALFPGYPFAAVRGETPGVPRKPDPFGALQACRAMDAVAEEAIYVGDSAVDVDTARNAGIFSAGATWGFRGADELVLAGVDVLLNEPGDLLRLLR